MHSEPFTLAGVNFNRVGMDYDPNTGKSSSTWEATTSTYIRTLKFRYSPVKSPPADPDTKYWQYNVEYATRVFAVEGTSLEKAQRCWFTFVLPEDESSLAFVEQLLTALDHTVTTLTDDMHAKEI